MRLRKPAVLMMLAAFGGADGAHAQPVGDPVALAAAVSGTVTVFAAASLSAAFQSIATAFEHGHPHLEVQLNFAGSSTLVQQIQQGARADVFASADEINMQKLVEAGALASAPQVFVRNRLQIVVPAGNPKHIASLADLTKSGLVIALCDRAVPCGRYATEAFGRAGVDVPPASQELDVKAVLSKVSLGEADAGIVYATDVHTAGGAVEGVDIPVSATVIARYPIAVLKSAPNTAAAVTFVDFVLSTEGQRVLAGFGFMPR
jgi:molybdate transport system substrate-binding protein